MPNWNALCVSGMVALVATPASAQDQPDAQSRDSLTAMEAEKSDISDIVVTATRRDQALQDVPISVTALSGDELDRTGLSNTTDLTQTMPALNFTRVHVNMQPTIRGVGTRDTATGNEANVSVYVDGVYQVDQVAGSFDLLNVARVEVLRGPQGTLFGRNATGGLIQVITNDPAYEPHSRFKLSFGRFNDVSTQAYVTAGLSENVAVDIGGQYQRRQGYIHDLVNDAMVGSRKSYSGRARVKIEPGDDVKVMLTASHAFVSDPSALYKQPWRGNDISRSTANDPGVLIATEPYTTALSLKQIGRARSTELSSEITVAAGPVTITDTFSFQKSSADTQLDRNSTPFDFGYTVSPGRGGKYYQNELRFVSNGTGPFSVIGGVYYINGRAVDHTMIVNPGGLAFSNLDSSQKIESVAGFGELTWDTGNGWTAIAGLRYTHERRRFSGATTLTNAAGVTTPNMCSGVPCIISGKKASFSNLSYRAILQRDLGPIGNVYASYSRGFKSGSFNTYITAPDSVSTRPEVLDAYEIGLKTDPLSWLRVNLAAFHYDYKNMQLSARLPGVGLVSTFNAARSKLDGGELEITARPARGLNLRAFASYLDARFASFPSAQIFVPIYQDQTAIGGSVRTPVGNQAIVPVDQKGSRLPRAPEYTFGGSISYTVASHAGDFDVSANVFRSGKFYWDFNNRTFQPNYTLVNAEVGWTVNNTPLRIAIWGRNLTDELVQSQLNSSNREDAVSYDLPRTYGISLNYDF